MIVRILAMIAIFVLAIGFILFSAQVVALGLEKFFNKTTNKKEQQENG